MIYLPDNVSGPCSLSEIVNSQRPAIVSVPLRSHLLPDAAATRGVAISAIVQEPARSPHPLPAFVMVCAENVREIIAKAAPKGGRPGPFCKACG